MDREDYNKKAKTIDLKADSDREFFLIHGYTGSPTDFSELPKILHEKFNANVKIILLNGHGTKIEDLDNFDYDDFFKQVEEELVKDLEKGRKIVIGGYSFGSQLAFELASKYPVAGMINVSIPYRLSFPLNKKWLKFLAKSRKNWRKRIHPMERELREGGFHYSHMPTYVLTLVKDANDKLLKSLPNVNCHCLSIFSRNEAVTNYKSIYDIEKMINSKIKEHHIFENGRHNVFYSPDREEVFGVICSFFEKNNVFNLK